MKNIQNLSLTNVVYGVVSIKIKKTKRNVPIAYPTKSKNKSIKGVV